jgi:prepilin-type N-terminal cleavage/methylation domain-containing protein
MLTRQPRGFTLVELMVVVAILALLLTLVVPIMAGFIASSKIRTAAESYATGLTHARAESIKQNTNVELLVSTGKWEVRRLSDSAVLQQAAGKEGSTEIVPPSRPTARRASRSTRSAASSDEPGRRQQRDHAVRLRRLERRDARDESPQAARSDGNRWGGQGV